MSGSWRHQLRRRHAVLLTGAWPVMGFFGLDVLLVYVAFKLNYRSGRLYETVELDAGNVQCDPRASRPAAASNSTATPIGRG